MHKQFKFVDYALTLALYLGAFNLNSGREIIRVGDSILTTGNNADGTQFISISMPYKTVTAVFDPKSKVYTARTASCCWEVESGNITQREYSALKRKFEAAKADPSAEITVKE